jgi:hypothetical protein
MTLGAIRRRVGRTEISFLLSACISPPKSRHSHSLFIQRSREVDEAARNVGANELHADVVAYIETLEASDYPTFGRRA